MAQRIQTQSAHMLGTTQVKETEWFGLIRGLIRRAEIRAAIRARVLGMRPGVDERSGVEIRDQGRGNMPRNID